MPSDNSRSPAVLLFDLGGVVMDIRFEQVFASWARASGTAAETLAERWSMNHAYEAHEVGAITFEQYCDDLTRELGIQLSIDAWRQGWNSLFNGPFHDVVDAIQSLPENQQIYAFSNTNNEHVACWRPLFGDTLNIFHKIYISSEIGARKPDVHAYHAVCDDIGTEPDRVLFFDDSSVNIAGAIDAGMQTVHVRSPMDVVRRLGELAEAR